MSIIGSMFKMGTGLVIGGFLISFVSPSLGLGLGKLGMVLIGGAILVPLAMAVVAVLVAGRDAEEQPQTHEARARGNARRQRQAPGEGEIRRPPRQTAREQPDLDAATINDYRR